MSRLALLLMATLAFAAPPLRGAVAPAKPASLEGKPADVYVTTKVMTMHLTVSPEAVAAMQPTRGGFGGPGGGAGKQPAPAPAPKAGEDGRKPRGGFGFDFAWVKGDLEIDGAVLKDVAVRYKGSGTYATSAQSAKRPFKIDLERHAEGRAFEGVKRLTLNNNVMDPFAARDAMSYAVYRAANVPAPRTAYVELSITVPGKYDKELLGLYTLVETIDKPFLKAHFGSSKGLLLEPERVGSLEYLGEVWKPYEERYRPKTTASKKARKRLVDFTRLVQRDDDATFRRRIDSFLDTDEFLRFLASTLLLANMDSFIGLNHNWMLYLDPKTDKFVFMPWDLDLSYGAFFPMGTPQQLVDLSIEQPYSGTNQLISRLFADEKVYDAYKGHLRKLMASDFTGEAAKKDLAAIADIVGPIQKREKAAAAARKEGRGGFGPGPGGMFANTLAVDAFVAGRVESVQAQLAGRSKGTVVRGFGGPGGPGGPGFRGFDPAAALVRPAMQAADKDEDGKLTKAEALSAVEVLFARCVAGDEGEVDEAALTKALDKILPKPPGFGGFAPPSQAPALARRIVERAGKGGKVTEARLLAEAGRRFAAADKDKDGKLDEAELAEALRDLVPPPQFGPPPAPPEERGPAMTFDPSPVPATVSEQPADAYEVKFLLPADRADRVEAWARHRLSPDPHGDAGRYATTSLYCDTDALDVYHRTPGFERNKHRLRRYGGSALIFLERKNRKGDRVRKRRVEVPGQELVLLEGADVSPDWAGAWFFAQLHARGLRPRCRVSYARTALQGDSSTGLIRLTLDRDVTGVRAALWDVLPVEGGEALLLGDAILELKYQTMIPPVFRELLAELPSGGGVSKYRRCVDACGLAGGHGCRTTG